MMENGKKSMLNVAYYGMIITMLALVVTLLIGLYRNDTALWVRVCWTIISVALVLLVIYHTVCIYSDMDTQMVGFVLFLLSVATVIVSFVFYTRLSTIGGLIPNTDLNLFLFVVGNLVLINLLTIAIYITGRNMKADTVVKPSKISSVK